MIKNYGYHPTKPARGTKNKTNFGRYSKKKPAFALRATAGDVGMTGFEPAASSSRTKRATGLRYIPQNWVVPGFKDKTYMACCKEF